MDGIDDARALLSSARRVVVLTGAGISTDSGIPDFRGPQGIWTKDPDAEMLSSYEAWVSRPEVRARGWAARRSSSFAGALPNAGHLAITAIERSGRLELLITQNIDRLHHDAGSSPERIVEIHGNAHEAVCLSCGDRQPIEVVLERVGAGEADPACLVEHLGEPCGGILKSATISFGQSLVAADLLAAEQAAERCDLLLAVGSTLAVYPVAGVVPLARSAGAPVVIINGSATEMDALADVVVHGDISTALLALVEGLEPVG